MCERPGAQMLPSSASGKGKNRAEALWWRTGSEEVVSR